MKKFISAIFIAPRWYIAFSAAALLFICSFFVEQMYGAAVVFLSLIILLTLADIYLLFLTKGTLQAHRLMKPRFSLGDENEVSLTFSSRFPFPVTVMVVEQIPYQFQQRNFRTKLTLRPGARKNFSYQLKPFARGIYSFGSLLCYVASPIGLLQRRVETAPAAEVKVYPSFLQLKKYQLMAVAANLHTGIRKTRRIGHSMEFEKIKNYVPGDDVRTINWMATARSGNMMVNTYSDTREQQVYVLLDKGRSMKMPFGNMTLLDYAINATLSLLSVVLQRYDKAGLITFSNTAGNMVPAERKNMQLQTISEVLYNQETEFKESDYETLLINLSKKITTRSLLILFTNFETSAALNRQLPYLRQLAGKHLLCVVFFQNTLLETLRNKEAETTEDIYIITMAQRFDYEKKQIVKELQRYGILSVLTTPQQLSLDVINKYLELKARNSL